MTEASKSVTTQDALSVAEDGHTADLNVRHYHFNVLQILQCAARKFESNTGRPARFFYAPEPFMYLVDLAVRQQAVAYGQPVPDDGVVRNVFGMELIISPGTCFTITAEDLVRDAAATEVLKQFQPTGAGN